MNIHASKSGWLVILVLAALIPVISRADATAEAKGEPDPAKTEPAASAETAPSQVAPDAAVAVPADAPSVVSNESLPQLILPPPGQISFTVNTDGNELDGHLVDEPKQVLGFGSTLYFEALNHAASTLTFSARIIAENVLGVEKNSVAIPDAVNGPIELTADGPTRFQFVIPEAGLIPGKYRLELATIESAPRVFAQFSFQTIPTPLPPADAVNLALVTGPPPDSNNPPAQSVSEISALPRSLYLSVTAARPITLEFNAQIVAIAVPGLSPNTILAGRIEKPVTIDDGVVSNFIEFPVPLIGFPAGRYRAELLEGKKPWRVIKTIEFTAKDLDTTATGNFNVADSALGGLLESVSGEEGAGKTRTPMILDADNSTPWSPPSAEDWDLAKPIEMVISFFKRQAALISAVEIEFQPGSSLPSGIEIWGSTQSATDGFSKLADVAPKEDQPAGNWRIAVPPTQVRFLKVVFHRSESDVDHLGVTQIRAIEGTADVYAPLIKRFPEMANWRLQPRHAAQQGLFFLQPSSLTWQKESGCLGCHVQAETLMGTSIARKNDYVVSGVVERQLTEFIEHQQGENGSFDGKSRSVFATVGLVFQQTTPEAIKSLTNAAHALVAMQEEDGSVIADDSRAPVEQGEIMLTSHALDTWSQALSHGEDAALKTAFDKGLAYVAQAPVLTTQDKVFKALTLKTYGSVEQQKATRQLIAQLQSEQRPDGSWLLEASDVDGPSSFATGQVLYAFRVIGMSPNTPSFQRGVQFLLLHQLRDGSWRDRQLTTAFAATMWPVIALAGSFGTKVETAHLTVSGVAKIPPPQKAVAPTPPPAPVATVSKADLPQNLELILDCSFSMNGHLEQSTRIKTAKQVMTALINRLPANLNVGLRLYGHRYNSMLSKSREDTELVLPIQPLNRSELIKHVTAAEAYGQTPLVFSTLKAAEDIQKLGGGSVVVVTDGEESCGGKPRKAGPQIAAMGVPIRVDIIGFTLTNKRVASDMEGLTTPTGGRYYTAADSLQLAAALTAATSPVLHAAPAVAPAPIVEPVAEAAPEPKFVDLPYDVLSADNHKVYSSSTLGTEAPEIEPGIYKVVVHDEGRDVALVGISVAPGETIGLTYDPNTQTLKPNEALKTHNE